MYLELIFFTLCSIFIIIFILIFNKKNTHFILVLLLLELILVFFSFIFILMSDIYLNFLGIYVSLIVLTLAACESVIGLIILLIIYKLENISFNLINIRK